MSRMGRRDEVTVNRVGPFRCAAILVAVLGGLLATPPAPARADTFDGALRVAGRTGTVHVVKRTRAGASVPIEWNLPVPPIVVAGGGVRPWLLLGSPQPLTCTGADLEPSRGTRELATLRASSEMRGSRDLDISRPEFLVGVSYYVRMCLSLGSGRHHMTNQVEIRMVAPPGDVDVIPAPPLGTPWIEGVFGRPPVRPGHWIGVTGRAFGERPGQLLLQIGAVEHRLGSLEWHSRAIVGQLDRSISGVPDGGAFLIVVNADGRRSNSLLVNFMATREPRLVPGGEVRAAFCSQEADENDCWSSLFPYAPSFAGQHYSYVMFDAAGESGTDEYSILLANGWRFHDLEWSHGEDADHPRWSTRGGETDHPSFHVSWHNPPGLGVHFYYGFRLYIIGPVGVPHR